MTLGLGFAPVWTDAGDRDALGAVLLRHDTRQARARPPSACASWISKCAPGTARRPISCSARCTRSLFWVTRIDADAADPAGLLLQRPPASAARHAGRHGRDQQPGRARLRPADQAHAEPFDEGRRRARFGPTDVTTGRDPAFARHAAILPDGAVALPVSAGQGGAEGLHPSGGRARARPQRSADAWRFPPQPVDRLPAGLRGLPRLRVGAGRGGGFPADPLMRRDRASATRTSSAKCAPAMPTSEQYSVFRAYLDARHRDGGMADMTVLDYAMMVEDSHVETRMVEYRRRDPDTGVSGRGAGPAARGRAHRRAQRRPVDGLFVLRSGRRKRARSAPS